MVRKYMHQDAADGSQSGRHLLRPIVLVCDHKTPSVFIEDAQEVAHLHLLGCFGHLPTLRR
jgi:hypothetical protein